ncbi:MAG: hypothetical protein PHE51_02825, partial [Eubacteriales bacterium]|nr:hypothetical protein [Eubacteriales bacterium]
MKNYILGIDMGIGSIGWGLIDAEKGKERIVDFGVRLFESGEENGGKDRTSQQRRAFRGARRLITRRSFRKEQLKKHLLHIGFVDESIVQEYYETPTDDMYELRTKALDEKVSPRDLLAILIHLSNHRGYNEFYEDIGEDNMSEDMLAENDEDKLGVDAFKKLMSANNYRSVGEMYYKDEVFKISKRNLSNKADKYVPTRRAVKEEAIKILENQKQYYRVLSEDNIQRIISIIFSQRDFEDGPGDKNDPYRKYKGFLDSIGKCLFYGDDERGFRGTVLGDLYAVCNTLSQYTYLDKTSGEIVLKKELANDLIYHLLINANLTVTDVKRICKEHNT